MLAPSAVELRLLGPDDGDLYRSILERTSADDRYFRFFSHVDVLDDAFIASSVAPRAGMIAVVAVAGGHALGSAHGYLDDAGEAELGIVVAEDARRRGVARALIERLRTELAARGATAMIAKSLEANHAFARLAHEMGMEPVDQSGTVTTWRLPIASPVAASP